MVGGPQHDNTMITAAQLAPLRGRQVDIDETERLKADLAQLRRERHPLYLTAAEFERILVWKLRSQIGRQRELRKANTDEIVRAVTGQALTFTHASKEHELEQRVKTLCELRGVGVPVVSAVLALTFPDEYAVIDFRGWRQCFGEKKQSFSVADYSKYIQKVRGFARELAWPVQEVDHAIWEYDRLHG